MIQDPGLICGLPLRPQAIDMSKRDLAAKRWFTSLVVANGFDTERSTVPTPLVP